MKYPRDSIGASKSPAICGLSPWSSPLREYLWYTGALDDGPAEEHLEIGTLLEDALRGMLGKRLGADVSKVAHRFTNVKLPVWLHASPDGIVKQAAGFAVDGAELKNVGPQHAGEWGAAGTDEVPSYVAVQCQHQMMVCGFARVHVGALLCGNEFRHYCVPRHDGAQRALLRILTDFWRRVSERDPPPPDWNDPDTPTLVDALYPVDPSKEVDFGPEEVALLAEYRQAADALSQANEFARAAKDAKAFAESRLVERMRHAAVARFPGGERLVRKEVQHPGSKPYAYTKVTLKKAPGATAPPAGQTAL